ncbi:MAG: hypothetical protein HRU38_17495 [Saccharospirillaceae bacterium]|nr:hypothetical protein [Pseudomonadales bacterium]NRB80434.1 hypothetical protein [Saccharospirillaceae bacterium]
MNKNMYVLTIILILISYNSFGSTAPSEINWLPESFIKKLKSHDCNILNTVEWVGDIKINVKGIVVGQFATNGQYDIAVSCVDKVFIHWGGSKSCANSIINRGESLEIPDESEVQGYLKRYNNQIFPSQLTHDVLGMYIIGKSSFYQYCYDGNWLFSDGGD